MSEEGNVLNLAVAIAGPGGEHIVVASWMDTHDAVIQELLSSNDVKVSVGKRYSTTGKSGSIHFTGDNVGRIYVCITKGSTYPARVAHTCLEELKDEVVLSKDNAATLKAERAHQFSGTFMDLFDSLVDKYEDPSQVDAITSVNRKVEVTTSLMQENITLLLENDSKIEELDVKAEKMNDQAAKFEDSSTELRKKMWWRLCKIRMCYVLVVVVILAVIIIPIVVMHPSSSSGGEESGSVVHNYYSGDGKGDGSEDDHDDKYWKATHAPELNPKT